MFNKTIISQYIDSWSTLSKSGYGCPWLCVQWGGGRPILEERPSARRPDLGPARVWARGLAWRFGSDQDWIWVRQGLANMCMHISQDLVWTLCNLALEQAKYKFDTVLNCCRQEMKIQQKSEYVHVHSFFRIWHQELHFDLFSNRFMCMHRSIQTKN